MYFASPGTGEQILITAQAKVAFDGLNIVSGISENSGSTEFTVNTSGYYYVSFTIYVSITVGSPILQLYIDSTSQANFRCSLFESGATNRSMTASGLLQIAAGNILSLRLIRPTGLDTLTIADGSGNAINSAMITIFKIAN